MGKDQTEPWGESSRGVKMRLRAPKTQWEVGEAPTLFADFLNVNNARIDQLVLLNRSWRIEVDGKWYRARRPDPTGRNTFLEFGPGVEQKDIPLPPYEEFANADGPLQFLPGKHTVRIHFLYNASVDDEGRYPDIHLVSNPLQIEILKEPPDVKVIEGADDTAFSEKMIDADLVNNALTHDGNDGPGNAARAVVTRWLALIEQGRLDEAAQLMLRGKNENADDSLSMTALLEKAANGHVTLAKVHAKTYRALVTTTSLIDDRYKGRSFVFHLASDWNKNKKWQIAEVSLVNGEDLADQLEAFNSPIVNQPIGSRGFGPVIERTLTMTDSHTETLDLDTNRLIRVPSDFDKNREVTQDPIKWLAVRGVDLGLHRDSDQVELRGIFLPRVRRVENDAWVTLTADRIEELLPDKQPGMPPSARLNVEDSLPVTYVFETSTEPTGTSRRGILQILGVRSTDRRLALQAHGQMNATNVETTLETKSAPRPHGN